MVTFQYLHGMNKHIRHKTFSHYLKDTNWNMLVDIATTKDISKAVVMNEKSADRVCDIMNTVEGRECWETC